jgi:Holliday junction resolvase RusA-like endonuclease
MITLTIPGPPVGKQRARVCRTGHAFTPAKTVNYETLIRELFAMQYPRHVPWKGPVAMFAAAFFHIPKATPRKLATKMEREETWYVHRIDGDNLWKIIADALNGFAYMDDGQIVAGRVVKYYSPRPRVEIQLEELT